jgi:hypothetical protein
MDEAKRGGAEVAEENAEKEVRAFSGECLDNLRLFLCVLRLSAFR